MDSKLLDWLRSGNTGTSSLTIAAIMENDATIAAMNRWHGGHPRDPADLWRCITLLDIMPEYRARLAEMARVSEEWKVLVEHWDELESQLRKEESTGWAPETYRQMRELLDPVVTRSK